MPLLLYLFQYLHPFRIGMIFLKQGYMDYSNLENIQPMFFRAVMKYGVIDVRDCEVRR